MRAEVNPHALDLAVAALAKRQYGVVSREQLRAAGASDSAIGRRVQRGRLHPLHRGVYAVGHTVIGARGRWLAAVLACGPTAALSHASAAALWELRATDAAVIDVTVPRLGARTRRGIRVHRPRTLNPDEVTTRHGIPVTTPARTLLDLAATLSDRALERALDRAEIQQLTDYPALDALARAHPGHRGARKLAAALNDHDAGTTLTKGDLEELFLALCRHHGLPKPRVNTWIANLEVDFAFPDHRVLVETDSWRHHKTRRAFENDRARDATLTQAGYRTLRFTHHQIAHQPRTVAAALTTALAD